MLKTNDLKPLIGSEVLVDRDVLLSGAAVPEIRDLLDKRGVLVFRGVNFTDEEQLAFTKTLGVLQEDGHGDIFKVTLDQSAANVGTIAAYLKSTFYWHIDRFDQDFLVRASILRSARLPKGGGGETEFCNTYAAYDELPESEKAAIDNLTVMHSLEESQRAANPEPTVEELESWQKGRKSHPLVWHHRSGRKSLLLGITAGYVEGMPIEEGRQILCRLREWATQPRFVYRHEWNLTDLLIWDNYGTMHRALPYAADSGRLMHRTTLIGEEPTRAVAA